MTRGSERGTPLPAAELARDPASVQLQQPHERLSVHADKLPPDLYDALQGLIAQAQDDVSGMRVCKMHERWHAACEEIAQGKTQEVAFEDAATRLAGTPAACGHEMVKKDFLAVQRARRGRLLPPYLYPDDEIYPARIGSGAALKFWSDDGAG